MIDRINQTFIKDFRDFTDGKECGIIVEAKYIDDRLLDDPDADPGAKELGSYYEFMISGALPKNGYIPKAEYNKNGSMTAAYRLATINAARVVEYLNKMGLRIVKSNQRLVKGRFSGVIDLVVEFIGIPDEQGNPILEDFTFDNGIVWKIGHRFVIDLKYSGLIGDTTPSYNKHGWKWSPTQKKYHGTQAIQYHYISNMDIYFLVTQSNNKEGTLSDIRLFFTPVSEFMVEQHIMEGNMLFDRFVNMATKRIGFTPRPSLKKCAECPLRHECKVKHTFPHPEIIHLDND
jgi:hypothetical protein